MTIKEIIERLKTVLSYVYVNYDNSAIEEDIIDIIKSLEHWELSGK